MTPDRTEALEAALRDLRAFVAVMVGIGPDAIIPETVVGPLGVPIKIGAIMRDVDAALTDPAPSAGATRTTPAGDDAVGAVAGEDFDKARAEVEASIEAAMPSQGDAGLVVELEGDLLRIQDGDRPLPWVVHSGSSYRRIASDYTRDNPRTFPDGNVLHGLTHSDGHPDLSMSEEQLNALVRIINAVPAILTALRNRPASTEQMREALGAAEESLDQLLDDMGVDGLCVCQAAKNEAIEALTTARAALKDTTT